MHEKLKFGLFIFDLESEPHMRLIFDLFTVDFKSYNDLNKFETQIFKGKLY